MIRINNFPKRWSQWSITKPKENDIIVLQMNNDSDDPVYLYRNNRLFQVGEFNKEFPQQDDAFLWMKIGSTTMEPGEFQMVID